MMMLDSCRLVEIRVFVEAHWLSMFCQSMMVMMFLFSFFDVSSSPVVLLDDNDCNVMVFLGCFCILRSKSAMMSVVAQ